MYDELSLRAAVASYAVEPLRSPPGTHFLYSNAGINLVGRIIECITGDSFSRFVSKRLLRPLQMIDTTLWPSGPQLRRLAKSYTSSVPPQREKLREVPFPQLTKPYHDRRRGVAPSGGYFSTAADCIRFGSAFRSEDCPPYATRTQTQTQSTTIVHSTRFATLE